MAVALTGLVFLAVVALIVGAWWLSVPSQRVRARLEDAVQATRETDTEILRAGPRKELRWGALSQTPLYGRLVTLTEQAGRDGAATDFLFVIGTFALAGGVVGWLRTGGPFWGVPSALLSGSLPVVYLLHKRHQRLQRLQQQLPDALDMMARAIRAGSALGGAIQLVGAEMPDPVGGEFMRVSEEIRLGLDPGEALFRLQGRVPTEDIKFFCAAIRIQREAGGNVAEILDRLSEVVRERYKLFSLVRVLSAQHRGSAVCVGLSPVIFAIILQLLSPGYFDPLLTSPTGPHLIGLGVLLEAIGFFMIWRIAKIKV